MHPLLRHPGRLAAIGLVAVFAALPCAFTKPARNPVIWADVPDLSIIRVGDAYYMSSTTMHMNPGLPIMRSMNLVNWNLVGYAYETHGDHDALRLENGKTAYGHGSWASSLRHHEGTFYASTFSSTTGKTHVYSTKDIENGPWKEASFSPALHDHSLFFDDDGRVYMLYGANNLRLIELTADASAIKPGGFNEVIIRDASLVAAPRVGLSAEGSQLFKIKGRYYVCNITWPPGGMRTQLVHRADRITGPYEGRVILRDRGIAQGGFIDTPDGKWYAYLFKDNGAVGRVPWLVPMRWEDGWPVLGMDGRAPDTLDIAADERDLGNLVASDEFERAPGDRPLPPAWQWNHNPDDRHWSLSARPGFLRLTTSRIDASLPDARNTLTQRTFGPRSSAAIRIDVSGMKDGDYAGLAAFQSRYGFIGVKMAGGERSLVVISAASGAPGEVAAAPLADDIVHLKVECDFRSSPESARFFHGRDGREWTPLGPYSPMSYTIPHFMGYRFALFHFATKTAGGHVDFDHYRVGGGAHDAGR
jgi:beta-xylosidase